jgi:hypothetical protein
LNLDAIKCGVHREDRLYRAARQKFGSWKAAIEGAGLAYEDVACHTIKYTDREAVLDGVRKRHKQGLTMNPSRLQQGPDRAPGLHEAGRRFFGSWKAAVEAAGIDYHKLVRPQIRYPTPEAVVKAIRRRRREKLPLRAVDLCKGETPDRTLYNSGLRMYGTWRRALAAANIKYPAS